jgi:hypothetical protein
MPITSHGARQVPDSEDEDQSGRRLGIYADLAGSAGPVTDGQSAPAAKASRLHDSPERAANAGGSGVDESAAPATAETDPLLQSHKAQFGPMPPSAVRSNPASPAPTLSSAVDADGPLLVCARDAWRASQGEIANGRLQVPRALPLPRRVRSPSRSSVTRGSTQRACPTRPALFLTTA